MGTKFKKGDKVRVKKDLEVGKYYSMEDSSIEDTFVDRMADLRGEVVTISHAGIKYSIEESMYNWTDGMFEDEVVEQEGKEYSPIVIYHRGDSASALDGNTGLECSATDETGDFDFYEAALAAVTNLIEHLTEPDEDDDEETGPFKVGDFIAGLPDNHYAITTDGWLGKVTGVHPSGRIDAYGLDNAGTMGITFSCLDPEEFRLATDDEITLEWLRKVWE